MNRGQRIAEGKVEVTGASDGLKRAVDGKGGGLPKVTQELWLGRGEGDLGLPNGVVTEEVDLVYGLPAVAMAHFGGAVGGKDDERNAALAGLDDGWKVVGARCA